MNKIFSSFSCMTAILGWSLSAYFFFSITSFLLFGNTAMAQSGLSDNQLREILKKDGATDAYTERWIEEYKQKKSALPAAQVKKNPSPTASGYCGDMGGENGWGAWEAATGDYWGLGNLTLSQTGLIPGGPRFALTNGTALDACTPGPNPGSPPVPVVAPAFGNFSIQMGETMWTGNQGGCNGGCLEELKFALNVTAADTNFIYAYAIVLEDPANAPHPGWAVPFAEIYMLDANNDTIPCSHHKYMGDTTGTGTPSPGMYKGACQGPLGNGPDVSYQPWTINGINLAAYVGQQIKVIIRNADCSLSGHFCHSYWDFMCGSFSGSAASSCAGQTTLTAPPSIPGTPPFTYAWYQNGLPYTGSPSASSQIITPTVQPGDTLAVQVFHASGCSFWMSFVPQPASIIPAFNYTGICGSMTFADSSTSLGSPIISWSWQFPGGSPGFFSSQSPGLITYSPGTYTVTLIITSAGGCVDSIHHSFTVGGLNTLMNQTSALCGNGNNGSASVTVTGGSAGYIYSWSNGGTTAQISNLSGGNYTVTVTDAVGCTASDTISVTSSGSITATATNSTICAGQSAALSASGGTNYLWSTGATTSSITPVAVSNATYSVIVSSGSCIDTAYANVVVTPSPIIDLGNDQFLCTGQTITLNAGNPGASYLWSNGSTSQSISVSAVGTFWVIAALNNCLAKDTVSAFIAPEVHIFDSSLCTVSPIVLDAGNGATSYLWSTGSTSQTIDVGVSGNYWVQVMFGNCLTSDTAKITGDSEGASLYIPNAFTPNGDFLNETFVAQGTGIISFDMSIFDRWGNLIFVSDDFEKGWNGKIEGGHYPLKGDGDRIAQEDVYVCIVNYKTQCEPKVMRKTIAHVSVVK